MKTEPITARIYWDNQDPHNQGWAWRTTTASGHEESGPLDDVERGEDATDDELIEAFRDDHWIDSSHVSDESIEIVRHR